MTASGSMSPPDEDLLRTMVPPLSLNPVKGGDFRTIGAEFASYCREYCGLAPGHRILDLGCGAGPLAVALVGYLSGRGRYEGLDVLPEPVDWCRREISARFPNFRFQVADVSNRNYNPAGSLRPDEYRLPFADSSFDVVHLRSVFTHMGPREVAHYLGEIARVLVPGGRCLATYFLLNAESIEGMRCRPVRQFPFEHTDLLPARGMGSGGEGEVRVSYRVSGPGALGAVAHDEQVSRWSIASAGLSVVEPVLYGRWSGREGGPTHQDIVIMQRPTGHGTSGGRRP